MRKHLRHYLFFSKVFCAVGLIAVWLLMTLFIMIILMHVTVIVGARFINLEVSTLVDKWYGESQKRAAAVFSLVS